MPYPASLVGRSTAGIPHEVDTRWSMAYAAGIGITDRRYFDTTTRLAVHPVFPVCLEWPAVLAARAIDTGGMLTRDELVRGVHATHHSIIHRPIRPPERLVTVATVLAVERRRPGTYEVLSLDTTDSTGRTVVTTLMGSLFLGVDLVGDEVESDQVGIEVAVVDTRVTVRDVAVTAAHVYTECARIHNPIHTDLAVARSAGLAGPILHGTATLAMGVSAMVDRHLSGDPAGVRAFGCRFGAMVPMPDSVEISTGSLPGPPGLGLPADPPGGADPSVGAFSVRNGAGEKAVRDGWVAVDRPGPTRKAQ